MSCSSQFPISNLSTLIEKMNSLDKDFRFMATNDLMVELQNDSIKLDDESERKIVKVLLKLLEDKNGEVQNLAVKCLGPLVKKVKEPQIEQIVETLCVNILSENEQLKDISSIGLKTVINQLPSAPTQMSAAIVKKITSRLLNTIQKDDVSVQLETLDVLSDILSHFGNQLVSFHQQILSCLVVQLNSQRMAVRKRAILAISYLVGSCNTVLFMELLEFLLVELRKKSNNSLNKTYIQCLASISRQAGHKVGENLAHIVPLVVHYCQSKDEELVEYSLQALEAFVKRCPTEISKYIKQIIDICLNFIAYDPNYNYDEDEDDANAMEDDGSEEENDQDDYSDDDDVSWKIRRAAAKCLESIISTRHELLQIFYTEVSPVLISRFKEREETVKCDIFSVYIAILQQTRPLVHKRALYSSLESDEKSVPLLKSQIAPLVKALQKQLKDKNPKTRQGCFSLLTHLVNVLPGALANHMGIIINGISHSLNDKISTSNMKIDTLNFLNCLLNSHDEKLFLEHLNLIVPPVISCVQDGFYKIASDALLVIQNLSRILKSALAAQLPDSDKHIMSMYNATMMRLKQTDIDQEVKERAITCTAHIISFLGERIVNDLSACWPIFIDRLRNEITRLTTVKAIHLIAETKANVNMQVILTDCIPLIASFLRKNQRTLKLASINCLLEIYRNYSKFFTVDQLKSCLIVELPPLINENDLHITQVTLKLITLVCNTHGSQLIAANILQQVLHLIQSPLMQGLALESSIEFFRSIVKNKQAGIDYKDLIQMLVKPIREQRIEPHQHTTGGSPLAMHKQAFYSIAKCIAVLIVDNARDGQNVITQFINDIKNPKSSDSIRLLSLLCLGETGKYLELSQHAQLEKVILDSFSSPIEEVKSAASYALGYLSVGNLDKYIAFILKEIDVQSKRQYLLLHSLKEIINYESTQTNGLAALRPYINDIWHILMKHCECAEEGTRNVVAECLGKLTLLDPENLMPRLQQSLDSDSEYVRSTVVTAIKFTITDQPQPIDNMLKKCFGKFLNALQDANLNVRRVALVTFNSAAHNKPSLVRDLLVTPGGDEHMDDSNTLIQHLYNETKIRKELIREVEMGPFKHTVDDGLDLRKAAFECMYTLLDSCLDRVDIFEFLNHVDDGLKDHYDIKMLTYLMLVRLSTLCPNALLQRLERLIDPLRNACLQKVRTNAVKQEYEKNDELKRSALRALCALYAIPEADKNPMMVDFVANIKSTSDLAPIFEAIQKESTIGATDSAVSMDLS